MGNTDGPVPRRVNGAYIQEEGGFTMGFSVPTMGQSWYGRPVGFIGIMPPGNGAAQDAADRMQAMADRMGDLQTMFYGMPMGFVGDVAIGREFSKRMLDTLGYVASNSLYTRGGQQDQRLFTGDACYMAYFLGDRITGEECPEFELPVAIVMASGMGIRRADDRCMVFYRERAPHVAVSAGRRGNMLTQDAGQMGDLSARLERMYGAPLAGIVVHVGGEPAEAGARATTTAVKPARGISRGIEALVQGH